MADIFIFRSTQISHPWSWGYETRGEHEFAVTDELSLQRALDLMCPPLDRTTTERQWRALLGWDIGRPEQSEIDELRDQVADLRRQIAELSRQR